MDMASRAWSREWVAILNAMSDGVAIVDPQDRLLHANQAFYDLIKQPYGSGVGGRLSTLLHPHRSNVRCVTCRTRQHGRAGRFKVEPFESANPTGKSLEIVIEPVHDARGRLLEVIETMRDLTAVERSEQRLVQLFESAADGILLQDPHSFAILDANQRACELFGYAKQEFARLPFAAFVPDNEIDTVHAAMANLRRRGAMRLETVITRKDGLQVPVEVSARLITVSGDPVIQVMLRDITERRIMEQALRERSALAQQLSEATLQIQEEERRRLARELHDGVGQTLSALKFRLEVLRYKPATETQGALGELSRTVGDVVDGLRNLAMQLRPSQLDDLGLVATLRWHIEQVTQQTGLPIEFVAREPQRALTPEMSAHVFRIAQECLNNICKHAQATAVTIALDGTDDGMLELRITDNGRGFEPEAVRQVPGQFHVGLSSMRERVAMMRGRLSIVSRPGRGTSVIIQVPLPTGAVTP